MLVNTIQSLKSSRDDAKPEKKAGFKGQKAILIGMFVLFGAFLCYFILMPMFVWKK